MANYIEKIKKLEQIKYRLFESIYERDKKFAKKMVESLKIPFIKEINQGDLNLVLKQNNRGTKNITIIKNSEIYFYKNYDVIEELIIDATGQVPPRSFQIYVFNHVPKLIEIKNPLNNQYSYYDIDWNFLNGLTIEKNIAEHTRPKHFYKMIDIASGISRKFNFPIRIDCFAAHDEVYFADCCLTPNIIYTLTERGNEFLGQGWHEHFMRKGIKDEFSIRERPNIYLHKYHINFL